MVKLLKVFLFCLFFFCFFLSLAAAVPPNLRKHVNKNLYFSLTKEAKKGRKTRKNRAPQPMLNEWDFMFFLSVMFCCFVWNIQLTHKINDENRIKLKTTNTHTHTYTSARSHKNSSEFGERKKRTEKRDCLTCTLFLIIEWHKTLIYLTLFCISMHTYTYTKKHTHTPEQVNWSGERFTDKNSQGIDTNKGIWRENIIQILFWKKQKKKKKLASKNLISVCRVEIMLPLSQKTIFNTMFQRYCICMAVIRLKNSRFSFIIAEK